MIELHQFPRAYGLPNPSPFCMKVETYLRLAGLDYEIVPLADPSKAPKGKGPYITDGARVVPDSHFILKYLKENYGDPLGEGLSEIERARHAALARMIEEHLYFALLHIRWLVPENAAIVRETFFRGLHPLVRGGVFKLVQKNVRRNVRAQGMGRHSQAEIEASAIEDLTAISTILGDEPYFGGDAPREIDCVAWGFIANTLTPAFTSPVRDATMGLRNLVVYDARMMDGVFPEL